MLCEVVILTIQFKDGSYIKVPRATKKDIDDAIAKYGEDNVDFITTSQLQHCHSVKEER